MKNSYSRWSVLAVILVMTACSAGKAGAPSSTHTTVIAAAPTTETPATSVATTVAASDSPTVIVPWGGPGPRAHLTLTLPDGWEANDGFVRKGDAEDRPSFVRLGSSVVANIYSEPCRDTLLDPPVGPTVDDLVMAFADAWGTGATTPTEATLDGYTGKQMILTVPADVDFGDCVTGRYMAWRDAGGGDRWFQGPGQIQESWIVDVDGERLLIEASYFPEISAENRAELQQVIDSIQIETE